MPPRPLTVVWDERFTEYDFGPTHPFTERSRALGVRLLEELLPAAAHPTVEWLRDVAPADRATLGTFHVPEYLDYVEEASLSDTATVLDAGDTPAFPGCYVAAGRIATGALRGLAAAEAGRRAFHPAGGLHHAHPDRASGFCIFNDVALAVAAAVRSGRRVAYVDVDAHHGDGVMYGFYGSGKVLDIDLHQDGRTLFPGTGAIEETGTGDGAGLKVNLPLPPLAGDDALVPLVRRVALPLLEEFRPELLIVQHGVDGHVGDPLARLQYTPAGYREVDRLLLEFADRTAGGRILVTGGGGYRPESVSRVLASAGAALAGLPEATEAHPPSAAWRSAFTEAFDAPAPDDWASHALRVRSPWNPDAEASLVGALERGLGRKFPAR